MKHMKHVTFYLLPVLIVAACAGTGAQHQPVLSAAPKPGYDQDLKACGEIARTQSAWGPETRTQAAIGATIGALAGVADDTGGDLQTTLAGAAVGAATGAAAGALDTRTTRKDTLIQCLRDRGYPVAG